MSIAEDEEEWVQAINILEVWANERGYHVEFCENGDNSICSVSKIIEINSSISVENQVYYLLHECGHALVFDNGSFYNFDKNR
jgi:Zn-dependent peptidase ImmA (M78 family)